MFHSKNASLYSMLQKTSVVKHFNKNKNQTHNNKQSENQEEEKKIIKKKNNKAKVVSIEILYPSQTKRETTNCV